MAAQAVGLPGAVGGVVRAASEIGPSVNWFQVAWVDAGAVTAQVVELLAMGNWSYDEFVGDPVGASVAVLAVAVLVARPLPLPAGFLAGDVDPLPEESFVDDRRAYGCSSSSG